MPKELLINVSDLEAPKPFEEVLQLISQMESGEYIRMLHRKKPLPLIQVLQEQGFGSIILEGPENSWEIIIWDLKDTLVNDFCLQHFDQQ